MLDLQELESLHTQQHQLPFYPTHMELDIVRMCGSSFVPRQPLYVVWERDSPKRLYFRFEALVAK